MSACGVTMHAIYPLHKTSLFAELDPSRDKIVYGILHSLVALVLIRWGGFKLFERVMTVCIGIMFVVVIGSAVATVDSWSDVLRGILIPSIPHAGGEGMDWTVVLIGGVGGTLTVMCYGYWIREAGRETPADLKFCRIDLATGYGMTALFGMAMVIIGAGVEAQPGGSASLLVDLSNSLGSAFESGGDYVRWAFLLGAWGAIFSSLLGVWQSLPYLFADFWMLSERLPADGESFSVDTDSRPYRFAMYAMATVPMLGLFAVNFGTAMKVYAMIGALVVPFLALVLLVLNNNRKLIGDDQRNTYWSNTILGLTLVFFVFASWKTIASRLG